MNFETWYAAVDAEFINITGLDRDSWPDACYYDLWEDGCTPKEAVAQCIYDEYGEIGLIQFGLELPY